MECKHKQHMPDKKGKREEGRRERGKRESKGSQFLIKELVAVFKGKEKV